MVPMPEETGNTAFDVRELNFPNGRTAQLVEPPAHSDPQQIIASLQLTVQQSVIVVCGTTGEKDLSEIFSRAIAPAAIAGNANIIGNGDQQGIMQLMGDGVADRSHQTNLIGISNSTETLNPNHTHFVATSDPNWNEVKLTFQLAEHLAKGASVVTVLAGGDEQTKLEVVESVRKGWPIVLIAGSGGLADQIAKHLAAKKVKRKKRFFRIIDKIKKIFVAKKPALVKTSSDRIFNEIIDDGTFEVFGLNEKVERLKTKINQHIADRVLFQAWKLLALYDTNAGRQQKRYFKLQNWIIFIGVLITLLALIKTQLFPEDVDLSFLEDMGDDPSEGSATSATTPESADEVREEAFSKMLDENLAERLENISWYITYQILDKIIIVAPIVISVMLAATNKFKYSTKWLTLRPGAEAIKREIYSYRMQSGIYSDEQTKEQSRSLKLAEQLKAISSQVMKSDVNESALKPYEGPIPNNMYGASEKDDGFSPMTAEVYVLIRIGDQLNYFVGKTNTLERKLKRLNWITIGIGGLSTLLAAVGLDLWIAFTTAVSAAIVSYLEYQQTETNLMTYNQTASDLENILFWWDALTADEKQHHENIDNLVEQTETILGSELSAWIKRMQQAQEKQAQQQELMPDNFNPQEDHHEVTATEIERAPETPEATTEDPDETGAE